MARTTINSLGVPAGTITAADLTFPLTDFSSTGIDDNATSNALTIDSSGNISVTGTVDGRDLATDGTKLDGIEASADVTDTTNVTAAGALMDSEVTNLAQVKAFSSSDYATAAQGTTADSALQNIVEDITPQLGGDLASNGNDILFADYDKAIFGAGSDLQIWHDGSHSKIEDAGTGDLKFITNGSGFNFQKGATETLANFAIDGAVTLYYDNAAKLATTSTGIDVTGTATMGGLAVEGTYASPLATFHSTSGFSRITLQENGVARMYMQSLNGADGFKFMDGDGTSERMRIDDSGNVILNQNAGAADNTILRITGGTAGFSTLHLADTADINIGFVQYDHTNNALTFASNNAERMRIDSSGNLLVGTTTHRPATNNVNGVSVDATFGIEASVTSGGPLTLNRKSTDGGLLSFKKDGTTVGSIGTDSNDLLIHSITAGHSGIRFANGTILPTNNSGSLAPNSIDIGSGTNTFKDLYLSGTANVAKTRLSTNAATTYWDLRRDSNTGHFVISDDGLGDVVTIKQDTGAVGIGTTNPLRDLQIGTPGSSATATISLQTNTSGTASIYMGDSTGVGEYAGLIRYSNNDNSLRLWTSSAERIRIDSSGLVGIGTTSPDTNLHIYNAGQPPVSDGLYANVILDTSSTTNYQRIRFDVGTTPYWGLTREGSTNNFTISGRINSTWSDTVLVITPTGKVGINTANPSTLLEVAHTTTGVANNISVYNSTTATSGECAVDWALERIGSAAKIRAARITAGKEQSWTTTASTVDGYLRFLTCQNESLNEAMRINSNGTLLVGATSYIYSSSQLELHGNPVYQIFRNTGSTAGQYYRIEVDTVPNFYVIDDNSTGVYIQRGNTSWSSLSDETLKENITDVGSVLSKITNYRTARFNWKNDAENTPRIGFIAQDWQTDFPEVISEGKDEKLGMNYTETIPILLKAIQELSAQVNELKAEVAALKGA